MVTEIKQRLGRAIRSSLNKQGWYLARTRLMPFGVDMLNDLARLSGERADTTTVVDVGANVGNWTANALATFPNATVHAFEPTPALAKGLRSRFPQRVKVVNDAVSDREGKAVFSIYDNPVYNSLCRDNPHHRSAPTKISVNLTTLDSYCRGANLETIDILKIDTEGHDIAVLNGAAGLLGNGKIRFVVSEFRTRDDSLPQLTALMRQHNFVVGAFYTGHTSRTDGFKYGDVLFLRLGWQSD